VRRRTTEVFTFFGYFPILSAQASKSLAELLKVWMDRKTTGMPILPKRPTTGLGLKTNQVF